MTVVLIAGTMGAAALGLRPFKAFVLLPVILLVAAAVAVNGIRIGLDPLAIALWLLAALAAPQIGYLVGLIGSRYFVAKSLQARASTRRSALVYNMRTLIGQELKSVFEPPRELPREILALLAQMNRH